LIPIPLTSGSVDSDGVKVIFVTSGSVPATAVYRGGFAFAQTGELYVAIA
jgi:hypothetical protein